MTASSLDASSPGWTCPSGRALFLDRWLACCGRACVHLGENGAGDLRGRFAEAVPSLVADENWSPEQVDAFIDSVGYGSPAAYIFRCRVCGRLRGYWNMD